MKFLTFSVILSIYLTACGTKAHNNRIPESSESIPVTIVKAIGEERIMPVEVSGLLTTENEARLSFKVSGVIQSIDVREGSRVRKGQLLATIIPNEINAQVGQAGLALEKAKRDLERLERLYQDSVVTLEQVQNAKTGFDIAQRTLQQSAFNQAYSRIHAPDDGFVARKLMNTGEIASPGSPVLLMNLNKQSGAWILKAGVSDKDWSIISIGNKASVILDAYPGQSFEGTVSNKSVATDNSGGSFIVEIAVKLYPKQAAVGMFGRATIVPEKSYFEYTIPYEALLEADGKQGYVFITSDRKTAKRVPVQIARLDEKFVYVEKGLESNHFVVVAGSAYLKDGSTISVVEQ